MFDKFLFIFCPQNIGISYKEIKGSISTALSALYSENPYANILYPLCTKKPTNIFCTMQPRRGRWIHWQS